MTNNDTTIALVTGGNTGIGFHLSRQLAQAGVRVLLGSRDPGRGGEAVRKLSAEGLDTDHLTLDVTDDAAVEMRLRPGLVDQVVGLGRRRTRSSSARASSSPRLLTPRLR